ncbi:hypothetical protein ACI6PS_00965 [Flavobacterium sp. PLA-1-15]|uniref:hypothetical protein n=1 Tax=Flavobacterium sp. PLA-1-15 TaxID=3380533 RepID=UPI003B76B9C3
MKNTIVGCMLMGALVTSCKDSTVASPANERMEKNHPTSDNNSSTQQVDTTSVIKDSLIDHNMKGQRDTHGKDTDAGR